MNGLLRDLEAYAALHKVPIIGPESAALLTQTVDKHQPRSILEIGSAIGYSALLMLEHAPAASLTAIELDPGRAALAAENFAAAGVDGRVTLLAGDAGILLPDLYGKYDMVFIDAAKGQYLDYLCKTMDKLLPGAVIFADNIRFRGWVFADSPPPRRYRTIVKRLRDYLDFVCADPRFTTFINYCGDGAAISHYQAVKERPDIEKT